MNILYALLEYVIQLFGVIFFILLTAKMIEIIDLINFIRIKGTIFSQTLIDEGIRDGVFYIDKIQTVMKKYDYPKKGPRGRFSSLFAKIKPKKLSIIILKVFHYHYLVPLLAFSSIVTNPSTTFTYIVLWLNIVLLVLSCLIHAFNLVWHQYIMGYADLIQKTVGLHQERSDLVPVLSPNQFLRDFLALLFRTLISIIIAYGGVYWTLERLHSNSFVNLHQGIHGIVDAFYYSLATITTTGAGPTAPNSAIAKIIASTEILVGVTLLGVLGLAFSASQQNPLNYVNRYLRSDRSFRQGPKSKAH